MQYERMKLKKPEIKSWDCVDHDPIEEWIPDDSSDVEFWCNISIGIEGETSSDNFLVHIVTQRALSRIHNKKNIVVIPFYESWDLVLSELQSIVVECQDIGWPGMCNQLSKHFHWEYEGMK